VIPPFERCPFCSCLFLLFQERGVADGELQAAAPAVKHSGVEELFEHGVMGFADLPERHDAGLRINPLALGDVRCDADDLGQRVFEGREGVIQKLPVHPFSALNDYFVEELADVCQRRGGDMFRIRERALERKYKARRDLAGA
jgi:hypothetical protein